MTESMLLLPIVTKQKTVWKNLLRLKNTKILKNGKKFAFFFDFEKGEFLVVFGYIQKKFAFFNLKRFFQTVFFKVLLSISCVYSGINNAAATSFSGLVLGSKNSSRQISKMLDGFFSRTPNSVTGRALFLIPNVSYCIMAVVSLLKGNWNSSSGWRVRSNYRFGPATGPPRIAFICI